MYKRVLIALDLEGVNNVVGEAYSGLYRQSDEWKIAIKQAALEVNTAASALFDIGVEKIGLWDNHGGGNNVDPEDIDSRIELISYDPHHERMSFARGKYDCICYFGYHAMEGTLGGVLAHTMSSKDVQYYKLNGHYIGEIDMDAYIAAEQGMPSVFFAGGDIACEQAKRAVSNIATVVTKTELERNKALFRDNDELFVDIKNTIINAVKFEVTLTTLSYPVIMEKSHKRVEDAAKYLNRVKSFGIAADYLTDDILVKDAHTVVSHVNNIEEFIMCI